MAEVGQAVERHLGGLQKESRQARLEALAGLRAAVLERPLPPAVLQEVFGQALLRPLTRCLAADPAERCRELALELLRHSLGRSSRPAAALPFVMPVLAQRLCLAQGGGGVGEPCEELRLGLLQLVSLLPQLVDGAALAPYLPELVRVLRSALLDPFPEAKREGCRAAAACAKAMPGGRRGSPPRPCRPAGHAQQQLQLQLQLQGGAASRSGQSMPTSPSLKGSHVEGDACERPEPGSCCCSAVLT